MTVYNVLRATKKEEADQIVVYGHSSLFYWWPVWLAREIECAGLTE